MAHDAPGSSALPAPASLDPDPWSLPLFTPAGMLEAEFLARLLEHRVVGEPATLEGFLQGRLAGVDWPILIRSPGDSVEGVLHRELSDEDLARLDSYFGVGEGLYVRSPDSLVTTADGGRERAFVYVPSDCTLDRYGMR